MIDSIYEKIIKYKIANITEIKGCSIEEVKEIENKFQIKLPLLYKEFLYKFGHKAGNYFLGTDIFFNKIFRLKEFAQELLDEDNNKFQLDKSIFVFAVHQGYQFMFFKLEEKEEDPAIYYYSEGIGTPQKKWDKFSLFLNTAIEQYKVEINKYCG